MLPETTHVAGVIIHSCIHPNQCHKIGNTSLVLIHEIVSEKLGKVAQGESVVVFYDPIKKEKCIIPDDVKAIISQIES